LTNNQTKGIMELFQIKIGDKVKKIYRFYNVLQKKNEQFYKILETDNKIVYFRIDKGLRFTGVSLIKEK